MIEAEYILQNIDEIMFNMRPKHNPHPSMCGRYPCWTVWLPLEGTVERKSLRQALIEYVQTAPKPEQTKGGE